MSQNVFMRIIVLGILLLMTQVSLVDSMSTAATRPTNKGIEIRVCQDRDCLTDGAVEAKELVQDLVKRGSAPKTVTVSKCGCLGPCGKGPNVDVRIDGIRVKDSRPGQNFSIFRNINSAESAASMLELAGMKIPSTPKDVTIESTRKPWDLDRTTRIALQRFIYACVALTLSNADQTGSWDVINGQVYPNSYATIAAVIFVASQFMGTGSKANAMPVNKDSE